MRKSLSRLSSANLIQHQQSSSLFDQESSEKQKRYSSNGEVWRDVDDFLLEHIGEVLRKFDTKRSQLDDEIWGKIILMEGGSRLAKAYLRNPVVVLDGSEHEFDGLRIGFNHFRHVSSSKDDFGRKIGDGVVVKMDVDGNIKAMARGTTPIYVQGWRERKTKNCISKKLWLNHGKLTPKSATISDNDRIYKVFDMDQFKCSLAGMNSSSDIRSMLFKTCIRIAMVKDGGEDNLSRTPCWFLIINMIAIDMIRRKLSLPTSRTETLKSISEPITSISPAVAAQDPLISLLTAAIQKVQNGRVEVRLETDNNEEDVMQKLATKLAMSIIEKREEESCASNSAKKSCLVSSPVLRLYSCNQRQISSSSLSNSSEVMDRNSIGRESDLQEYDNSIMPSRISPSTISSSSSSLFLPEEPVRVLEQERQPKFVNLERCAASELSIPANCQSRRYRQSKNLIHTNNHGQPAHTKPTSLKNGHSEYNINTSDYESHRNGNGMFDAASSLSYNSSLESDTDSERKLDCVDIPRGGLYRTQVGFETDSVPHYYSQNEEHPDGLISRTYLHKLQSPPQNPELPLYIHLSSKYTLDVVVDCRPRHAFLPDDSSSTWYPPENP